jgi:hypothetical protein
MRHLAFDISYSRNYQGKLRSWSKYFHDHLKIITLLISWNMLIYCVAFFGRLQEIQWDMFGKLTFFCPLTNGIEVFAFVPSIEVNICLWSCRIPPNLAEYASVYRAHELLSNDVETVG